MKSISKLKYAFQPWTGHWPVKNCRQALEYVKDDLQHRCIIVRCHDICVRLDLASDILSDSIILSSTRNAHSGPSAAPGSNCWAIAVQWGHSGRKISYVDNINRCQWNIGNRGRKAPQLLCDSKWCIDFRDVHRGRELWIGYPKPNKDAKKPRQNSGPFRACNCTCD